MIQMRRALVEKHRPYVLEQIEHIRKQEYSFSEWVVLFLLIDDQDEEAKTLGRLFGWTEKSENDLLSALVRRDELCRAMRANKILGDGIIEQDIKPGKIRCVVFGSGCGIQDVDVPLSAGN